MRVKYRPARTVKFRPFMRTTATYLAICLLVMLLCVPIYVGVLNILRENVGTEIIVGIQQGLRVLEIDAMSLYALTTELARDANFASVRSMGDSPPSADYIRARRAQQTLANHFAGKSLFDLATVYFRNTSIILASDRLYIGEHAGYVLLNQFEGVNFLNYYDSMFSRSSYMYFIAARPFIRAGRDPVDVLTCWISLPMMAGDNHYAVLTATMPVDSLLSTLGLADLTSTAIIQLRNREGELIFFSEPSGRHLARNGSIVLQDNEADIWQQSHGSIQKDHVLVGNERYSRFFLRSVGDTVSVMVAIPDAYFSEMLEPLVQTILLWLLIALAIGILAALVLAYINVQPLQTLVSRLTNNYELDTVSSKNDYQFIEEALAQLYERQLDTQRQNQTIQHTVKAQLLEMLLTAPLSHRNKGVFAQICPDFPETYRILLTQHEQIPQDLSWAINEIPGVYYQVSYHHILVLFLNVDASLSNVFLAALERVASEESIVFALSTMQRDPDEACRAYRQAQYLLKLRQNDQRVIIVDNVDFTNHDTANIDTSNRLYNHLFNGDMDEAQAIVLEQWYQLGIFPSEGDQIRILFFSQLGILAEVASRTGYHITLPEYDDRADITQLAFGINAYIEGLCDNAHAIRNNFDMKHQNIIDFIREHYAQVSFSSAEIEMHFHLSGKSIAKIVKAATGMGIAEYIEQLRIEKAEQLLADHTISISQIAADCGYISQNTFYKAFRRINGVSPSVYRALQKD